MDLESILPIPGLNKADPDTLLAILAAIGLVVAIVILRFVGMLVKTVMRLAAIGAIAFGIFYGYLKNRPKPPAVDETVESTQYTSSEGAPTTPRHLRAPKRDSGGPTRGGFQYPEDPVPRR